MTALHVHLFCECFSGHLNVAIGGESRAKAWNPPAFWMWLSKMNAIKWNLRLESQTPKWTNESTLLLCIVDETLKNLLELWWRWSTQKVKNGCRGVKATVLFSNQKEVTSRLPGDLNNIFNSVLGSRIKSKCKKSVKKIVTEEIIH